MTLEKFGGSPVDALVNLARYHLTDEQEAAIRGLKSIGSTLHLS